MEESVGEGTKCSSLVSTTSQCPPDQIAAVNKPISHFEPQENGMSTVDALGIHTFITKPGSSTSTLYL
jgi:hypothetical protein